MTRSAEDIERVPLNRDECRALIRSVVSLPPHGEMRLLAAFGALIARGDRPMRAKPLWRGWALVVDGFVPQLAPTRRCARQDAKAPHIRPPRIERVEVRKVFR